MPRYATLLLNNLIKVNLASAYAKKKPCAPLKKAHGTKSLFLERNFLPFHYFYRYYNFFLPPSSCSFILSGRRTRDNFCWRQNFCFGEEGGKKKKSFAGSKSKKEQTKTLFQLPWCPVKMATESWDMRSITWTCWQLL